MELHDTNTQRIAYSGALGENKPQEYKPGLKTRTTTEELLNK